jgi:hypothetical protein
METDSYYVKLGAIKNINMKGTEQKCSNKAIPVTGRGDL